jgi:hypothetical protein
MYQTASEQFVFHIQKGLRYLEKNKAVADLIWHLIILSLVPALLFLLPLLYYCLPPLHAFFNPIQLVFLAPPKSRLGLRTQCGREHTLSHKHKHTRMRA